MSSIFGFAWLDGRPAAREGAERMARAAALRQPDDVSLWYGEQAVFGRALVAGTQEDAFDRMPQADHEQQVVVTAAGRLDNREELCDDWYLSSEERHATADSALVCRAYLSWGDAAPARLRGDWAMAAWHRTERRLFLARDHTGQTGIFYRYQPPFVAFASSLDVLLALPEVVRRVNEEWVARALLVYPGPLDQTFFEDVRHLIPAHHLDVTPAGLRCRCYWSAADAKPLPPASSSEYVEGFLERYRAAVRARLRGIGPIASTLSSGLDSGSVTSLAADELRRDGRPLLALTAVPRPGSIGAGCDEGPMAREAARRWNNVTHELVDASSSSPVSALDRALDIYPAPVHGAANLYWLLALFGIARAHGARVLLIGQSGNVTVSWNGGTFRLLGLLRRAPFAEGWPALRATRAAAGVGWARAIGRHVVAPLVGRLKPSVAAVTRPAEYAWERWAAPNRELLRRLVRAGRLDRMNAVWKAGWIAPRDERVRGLLYSGVASGPFYHAAGTAHRLEIRDPTTDVRLVEYCFALPEKIHTSGGGDRVVIRTAMRGLLPESTLQSSRRARQASDLCARLIATGDEVDAAIERLDASPLASACLDVPALRRAWHLVRTGHATAPFLAQSKLSRGLMVGMGIVKVEGL